MAEQDVLLWWSVLYGKISKIGFSHNQRLDNIICKEREAKELKNAKEFGLGRVNNPIVTRQVAAQATPSTPTVEFALDCTKGLFDGQFRVEDLNP